MRRLSLVVAAYWLLVQTDRLRGACQANPRSHQNQQSSLRPCRWTVRNS